MHQGSEAQILSNVLITSFIYTSLLQLVINHGNTRGTRRFNPGWTEGFTLPHSAFAPGALRSAACQAASEESWLGLLGDPCTLGSGPFILRPWNRGSHSNSQLAHPSNQHSQKSNAMLASRAGLCRREVALAGSTGPRHSPRQGRRRLVVSASLPLFVPPSDLSVQASASVAASPIPALLVPFPTSDAARFATWPEAPSLEISPLEPIDDTASQFHSLTDLITTPNTESNPSTDSLTPSHYTSYYVSDSPLQTLPPLADASVASNPNRFQLPQGEVPILDAAKVLTPAKAERLAADISALERDTGWRIRILTRFAPGTFDVDEVRAYWKVGDPHDTA